MDIVYTDRHVRHQPKNFLRRGVPAANPEVAARASTLLDGARNAGHRIVAPDSFGAAPRAAVHTAEYLTFLETAIERWQSLPEGGAEIVPNIHPNRHMANRPTGIIGLVGWHTADTACPISTGTWEAATAAADVAVHATELVLTGAPIAYGLCRPPGHHAYADMAGGFCYLNNAAIAAQHAAQKLGRIAILDIDVHHGNGTQGIFWERGDVFFASVHADPTDYYPFYAGYADERGTGAGLGANLNIPLAIGSGDEAFLGGIDRTLSAIADFDPALLVVSLGFDAYEKDPLGVFKVTTAGFGAAATRIAGLRRPTVLIQEGGYLTGDLGVNLARFLKDYETALS
ncbi:MAG TPA: histone deacetylase family protein [Stellaceae bacterium]|nr:histone deacetylase family protein [Stellaceae bacterium]